MFTKSLDRTSIIAAASWNDKGRILLGEKKYNEAIEAYSKAIAINDADPDYYCNRAQAYSCKGDYFSAAIDTRSALVIDPKHVLAHYRRGYALLNQKKFKEAIEAYTNAISYGGARPVYYTHRALAHSSKGDHLSAIKDAQSALAIDPENTFAHFRLGWALFKQRRYDEAIEAYTKAIALGGAEPDYYSHRAVAYSSKGDHITAIKDSERALAIDPNYTMGYFHLGWVLMRQGKYDEAIQAYTRAIALDRSNLLCYSSRAEAYSFKGDHRSAIIDIKTALAIDSKFAKGYYRLGWVLLRQGKYEEAIEACSKAIGLDDADPEYFWTRVSAYSGKGDHASAFKDAQSALALNPKHAMGYSRLGWALFKQAKYDEAIDAYTKAITLDATNPLYYCNRALAYLRKGDKVSATKDANRVLAINPKFATGYSRLGREFLKQEKYDEAIGAYTKAIAVDGDNPSHYCDRAEAYSDKGDHSSAVKDAESAIAINPKHSDGYFWLGWALDEEKKYDEAIEAYTKAIALDGRRIVFYDNRAYTFSSKGDYMFAIKDAKSALAINPKYDVGFYRLGCALLNQEKYDEAIEAYTNAIGLDSTNPHYYSARARAYSSKGDHLSAMSDAQSALGIDPNYATAYSQLGQILFQQQKYDQAIEKYTAAIAHDGTNPAHYCNRAQASASKGDYISAIIDAKSALEINPNYDLAYNRLGLALFKKDKYDEAIDAYTHAIALDTTNPHLYCDRAQAYSSKGDHLSAVNDAHKALALHPNYDNGYYRLGYAHHSLGHFENASNALKRGLEVNPDHADLKSLLAIVQAKPTPTPGASLAQGQVQQVNRKLQDLDNKVNELVNIQSSSATTQDLQLLENHLLRGFGTVEPCAIECLTGTRVQVLADIAARTDDKNGPNVLWIRGGPGSGKSSISPSAKSRLQDQCQLVTYFRFDRNESTTTTSTALWGQVAHDLARLLPSVRTQLLETLQTQTINLNSSFSVFTSLIEKPLSNLIDPPSLVIVIDALDECGSSAGPSSQDRRSLLQALRRWRQLPSCFKLLVTSRDESDIDQALSSISITIDIPSGNRVIDDPQDDASIHASNDIRTFLKHCFLQIRKKTPSLPAGWPGSQTVNSMVHRAAGNFRWATTAADFIASGIDPRQRLGRIMDPGPEPTYMKPLYSLYTVLLETALANITDDSSETMPLVSVLGIMVLTRRPLSDEEYMKVLAASPVTAAVLDSIRSSLRSVIAHGPDLRFAHKSFNEFLLSKECPIKYRIRTEESHYLLTKLCLATMSEGLHFNMCGLETSSVKNADIPEHKVRSGISTLLSYSCCFWVDHLSLIPFEETLLGEIKTLILDKLLYWFEAMSLLKEMHRVSHSLLFLLKWSHSSPDDEFKDFLHDARLFVAAFDQPMVQSAPHIYISALAFAPKYSSVAQHFLPEFPQVLAFSRGKPVNWPACIFTTEHHKGKLLSTAFSSDEKYFVSGTADGAVFVCDSDTGNLIAGPLSLGFDSSSVDCVCFDSDTRRVWAAMGQVAAWDIDTGNKHLSFDAGGATSCCCLNDGRKIISVSRREGRAVLWSEDTGARLRDLHVGDRLHMVAFSPDGCFMACAGEYDKSIGIWKLVDGSNLQGPSHSQHHLQHESSITTLSFSVEGNCAVSGSIDGAILIWDARTGDTVSRPLETSAEVNAVAYSSQRNILVSASGDSGAVMVWNSSTHEVILGPLKGHLSLVKGIALSRDCQRAITASWDGTVRMWDLFRKGVVLEGDVNEGHTAKVRCVAFSPCGAKLASLDQWAIRIWDVETGQPLLPPINNELCFTRIIFCPDGGRLVAYCSSYSNIRLIDIETGELVPIEDPSDAGWGGTRIEHVSFRSSDKRLITCSDHGVVRIWKLGSEGCTLTEDSSTSAGHHQGNVDKHKPLAFLPDGSKAIVHDGEHHYIWSTTTYRHILINFTDSECLLGDRVAYSPSGQFFAAAHDGSSEDTLRVWNADTGKIVAGPFVFDGRIDCIVFSSDNHHIAFSCSSQSTSAIRIWNIHTGRQISVPKRHTGNITALAFSPDGETLASASDDFQIRLWTTANILVDSRESDGHLGVHLDMEDGWVRDAEGGLVFWVPKDHRARLILPGNVAVLGGSGTTTELDLSKFIYGEKWKECFEGEK